MATKLSVNFQVVKQQLWRLKRHLSKRILVIEFCQNHLSLLNSKYFPGLEAVWICARSSPY